jgi:hypothetical protein
LIHLGFLVSAAAIAYTDKLLMSTMPHQPHLRFPRLIKATGPLGRPVFVVDRLGR